MLSEDIRDFIVRLEADIARWEKDAAMLEAAGFSGDALVVRGFVKEGTDLLVKLKSQHT